MERVRPRATKLTDYHKKERLKFCGRNPKHHRRWVFDSEELDLWEVKKFSKGLHVYGGMTSKALTPLIFINGNINGERYVNEILPILTDVQGRTKETNDITTTILFDDNEDWIFEQNHATCHDTNIVQEYLTQNVSDFFW
ncbi:unnamed protein product [Rotaria sp. Silwood2]|nr:unnamed protein product [Rotaria sp. Silwood2]CAF2855887.1 unnamed protein product [Rotaria sp. Silwood2]CAF3545620.1 unnamed protein product [Rotaria sp. Silwood2]CAF4257696.1 unnamed protein product [Rotaria sp. Silwood2]CAF4370783.1 unnamed protein product [Rotaria sp. Silwood2]